MLINEVENIVGLSKKSIRYYEANGLLNPVRNKVNDYRIYNEEDVKKLKTIKFLRELGVPIKELKDLNKNKLTLSDCLYDRIKKIEKEEIIFKKIKEMCLEIIKSDVSYENIDITKYFESVNIINKEGFTLRDVKTSKAKKIWGAVLSSVIFSLFFVFLVGTITYFQLTEAEKMPWLIYGAMMFIFLLPLLSIGYNLVLRIKEINGGEEDEASKY